MNTIHKKSIDSWIIHDDSFIAEYSTNLNQLYSARKRLSQIVCIGCDQELRHLQPGATPIILSGQSINIYAICDRCSEVSTLDPIVDLNMQGKIKSHPDKYLLVTGWCVDENCRAVILSMKAFEPFSGEGRTEPGSGGEYYIRQLLQEEVSSFENPYMLVRKKIDNEPDKICVDIDEERAIAIQHSQYLLRKEFDTAINS